MLTFVCSIQQWLGHLSLRPRVAGVAGWTQYTARHPCLIAWQAGPTLPKCANIRHSHQRRTGCAPQKALSLSEKTPVKGRLLTSIVLFFGYFFFNFGNCSLNSDPIRLSDSQSIISKCFIMRRKALTWSVDESPLWRFASLSARLDRPRILDAYS